uniref:Transposase n=1 Tax=Ditylenchus dipsaci TaxID=166011 RepID=A0A915CUY0_9BILA
MSSNVWKLKLFKKISPEETICEKCNPPVTINTKDGSTKLLKRHVQVHPEAAKIFTKLEEGVPTQDISQFMMKEKSDSVSVLDKKILNFLASNCLPFSIMEEKSFKNLLSINDRTSLQGRRHYSDWVLHRFYKEMKNKSKEKLSMITSLSFTTDIWSGPTESFIRFVELI